MCDSVWFLFQLRLVMMSSMPAVVLFALAFVMACGQDWLVKGGLFVLVYLYANVVMNFFFDERMMRILPISIYLSSKVGNKHFFPLSSVSLSCFHFQMWFYYVWLFHIHPFVGPLTTLLFLACSTTLWYSFLKTWRGDPGVVSATKEEKFRTIIELAEREG